MGAKDIVLRPIGGAEASAIVKRYHYSGKVVNNSQLHIGVYYNGKIEGAMQFGPSLDKRKIMGLVEGTGWNDFIELNRMAFSDRLPRNSESRALAVAMKLLRKHAPHIQWVISFADGTQSGDGAIYRAAGFVLTSIKVNTDTYLMQDGKAVMGMAVRAHGSTRHLSHYLREDALALRNGAASSKSVMELAGGSLARGYQLRYIYFLDPTARERLTVPILPFSEIGRVGAGMYRGKPVSRAGSIDSDASAIQSEEGGAVPTPALQEATV